MSEKQNKDRLPPHDERTEQSVIGCLLMDNSAVLTCMERFGGDEGIFYDLKHETVWLVVKYLQSKAQPTDLVSVQSELNNRGLLEQVGGIVYLSECEAQVPSTANLTYWMEILWEKYIARRTIQQSLETARSLVENNGDMTESFITVLEQRSETFRRLMERGSVTPKHLCKVSDFGEAYFNRWFNPKKEDEYGYELPFPFPFRIRPNEMDVMTGDNGSGKSSFLGQLAICCGKQFKGKEKIVIASMEVPPEITLWIMSRQLMGVGKLDDTEENRNRACDALAWLNSRVLIYNFLGITDWRELLNTFRYARAHEHGEIFIVDSVMKIGIQDDDYATQAVAANAFADFSIKTGAHTVMVVHENKGDGRAKDKVRGSKQWTDLAHNICGMKRNEEKAAAIEELNQKLESEEISESEHAEKAGNWKRKWDAKFLLHKQRWPGSQQNGSRWLWFKRDALQFHTRPDEAPFNFLLP
jgi:KaiC/GvpD/RAD55 family RecA-like ATPase